MGWDFRAACPDCRHEWEGVETSFRIGPLFGSSLAPAEPDRSWFCAKCCHRLVIPPVIDRNAWAKWHSDFLAALDAAPADVSREFLREVAARLDAAFATARRYMPVRVDPGRLDCPGCGEPFGECVEEVPDRVACPRCGGRNALLQYGTAHCIIGYEDGGIGFA